MHSSLRTIDDMMKISDGMIGRVYASINPDSKAYKVDKSHLIKGGTIVEDGTVTIRPDTYGYNGKQFQNIHPDDTTREEALGEEYATNIDLFNDLATALNNMKTNKDTELPQWATNYMDLHKVSAKNVINLLDNEENRLDFLATKDGYTLPKKEKVELIESDSEEEKTKSESESEEEDGEGDEDEEEEEDNEEDNEESDEEEEEEGTFTNDFGDKILPYVNDIFIDVSSGATSFANAGIDLEISLTANEECHEVFDYIFDNSTPQKVYNSGNITNPEYTDEFKKLIEKVDKKNEYAISQGNVKPKLDYYLFDFFVGNNEACELKCLSKSYKDYQREGYINLVQNKITGGDGEFKPIYNTINNKKVLKQVVNEYNDFGVKKLMNTMKNENIDYRVMYFLQDGIYYYEPLKDPNFIINANGKGRLNYDTYTTRYGVVEYKIPINKLKHVPQNIYNKIFK